MIQRNSFRRDYYAFWGLQTTERPKVDGSLIALISVMLAKGTQLVTVNPPEETELTAELYLSASDMGKVAI